MSIYAPRVDRIGKRHSKLTVVENLIPSQGLTNYGGLWRCVCDCGQTCEVKGYNLYMRTSCGCARREASLATMNKRRRYAGATIAMQYRYHCSCAKAHSHKPLPKDQWQHIVLQPCHYCGGIDIKNVMKMPSYRNKRKMEVTEEVEAMYDAEINGVDRVDSSRSYEIDNCVPCCAMCNTMKLDYSTGEFFARVKQIYEVNNLQTHKPDAISIR